MRMEVFMFIFVMVYLTTILPTQASLAKPGCQERCGNLTIAYPYGIGSGCYLNKSFEVFCNRSSQSLYSLQIVHNQEIPILDISTESVRVVGKPDLVCGDHGITTTEKTVRLEPHFSYSHHRNIYVAVGCDTAATFYVAGATSDNEVGCSSLCLVDTFSNFGTCMGIDGCCQKNIPAESAAYTSLVGSIKSTPTCSGAFIIEKNFRRPLSNRWQDIDYFPVALNLVIDFGTCQQAYKREGSLCGQNSYCVDSAMGHGYRCRCLEGYKGNPYLPDGCKDINERQNNHSGTDERCVKMPGRYECVLPYQGSIAFGIVLIVVIVIGYWAYIKLARRKKNVMKQKCFIRNGGQLLKQQISGNRSSVMKIKIYTEKEMLKATEGFNRKRILGKGGQGTVYKGLLPDGTVVAIKKSNAVDEDQVEQFVNELLILAQINHRNVVKLLGCCLEYEVPLLVYEYLSNGTLSEHLFDGADVSKFSWKDRIRIAKEVAEALAYLHSYASSAIFHRDIKPVNILLDENYRAVLSDFGLSRSIPLSRTHLTTQVEGTFGYLDPEYFESGQFTAKSDVYAFGVVLTELLTKRKVVSSVDSDDSLIPRFQYLMKQNRVFEILDKQVTREALINEVFLVTKLAKRCMKRNAKKRPSMKEVIADLNKIRLLQREFPHKSAIDDFTSAL
uniref:putative wall-associated receptor kinase-like 16 n=1 Tax=Erigeron canadensis TaxID=72917 RepID=UPI001CB989E9|nr:putative wall-associated receptor kinase-like 16 [Erigeron canadensis]